jgi:L-arabinokinase
LNLVFYVSGHGFGHATRAIELIDRIAALAPDTRFRVRTTAPSWLFARARTPHIEIHAVETDTGMVQIDGLRLDDRETARRAAAFYATLEDRVEAEARFLISTETDVVVGDIPPLAFAAAHRAGLKSVAVANFTWDWIYAVYPAFEELAPGTIPAIRAAYAMATRALRLPFHGGFEPMAAVTTDIPLIARRSQRDRVETRRLLGAAADRPLVLASFGAYGAALPHDAIRANGELTLLTFEQRPPHGLAYEDLVAAADVVVTKPGYGIVSECVANGTALLYTPRGRFIEYDVLVAQMPRVLRCRLISSEDFLAGRLSEAVAALLRQPQPPERWRIDGAAIAAQQIVSSAAR